MSELMEFIGREAEVRLIVSQIKQTKTRALVFVRGEGGLGKTRLLQEIRKKYVDKDEFLATEIIDFDDRSLHIFGGTEIRIAEELGVAEQVATEIQSLRSRRSGLVWQGSIEEKQQEITTLLRNQFNLLSGTKRILFFFDTTEKIGEDTLRRLLSLLSHFENGVFLFAGRPFIASPKVDISQLMKTAFGKDAVIEDLQPLNMENSREYLRAKLRTLHSIKDERVENLLKLVDGRPILIELTAQWLSIDQPSEWLLNELQSLPDEDLLLVEAFKQKQKDFQTNLVRHITQLRTPLDRLLLALSRVYPFDVEMMEELLGLSRKQAEMLMESAKKYVFVKTLPGTKITLHDEMRRMVNDLVWEDIDRSKERRRHDSRRAAAIFERRRENLANNQQNEEDLVRRTQYSEEWRRIEQEVLEEQWVEHALFADKDSGFEVFSNIWIGAVKDKDYFFAKRILEIANGFSDKFNGEQQLTYTLWNTRQKNYTGGNIGEMIPILRKFEKAHVEDRSDLSAIYNALGMAERKSGSMKKAASYLRKNLEIIKETYPSFVPRVANQLGYTYRLMGDLVKAESTYKYGLKMAMEAEEHDKDVIASLLNNLGYVFGIKRQYDVAENHCLQAADLWKEIGLTSQIGRVDISLGIFHRDRGNYEQAIELFDQAIVRAWGSDDFEIMGLAYCHLAWAKLFKWEVINRTAILEWDVDKKKGTFIDKELLIEARKNFDYCLTLAEERNLAELLPSILHQMSNVYWWLGWLEDEHYKLIAREYNTKALEESEIRDNFRYAIDSLVGNAEFDYDAGDYRNIPAYAEELRVKYGSKKKQHLLYFGRMDRILGDIAYNGGEHDEALKHYTEALPKIQRHGGYGKYSTQIELLRLERKLDKLSISEVNMWLKHFQEHWKKRAELIHWCEKEQLRTRLRIKQRDYVES